jgi:hypothetical protein
MPDETENPELTAVSVALTSLAPSAGRLDRDQILYRAGQASMRHGQWPWPTATALLAVVSLGLGIYVLRPPEPQTLERIVYVHVPIAHKIPEKTRDETPSYAPPPSSDSIVPSGTPVARFSGTSLSDSSPFSYYQLEQVALRWGVEELPETRVPTVSVSPIRLEQPADLYRHDASLPDQTP